MKHRKAIEHYRKDMENKPLGAAGTSDDPNDSTLNLPYGETVGSSDVLATIQQEPEDDFPQTSQSFNDSDSDNDPGCYTSDVDVSVGDYVPDAISFSSDHRICKIVDIRSVKSETAYDDIPDGSDVLDTGTHDCEDTNVVAGTELLKTAGELDGMPQTVGDDAQTHGLGQRDLERNQRQRDPIGIIKTLRTNDLDNGE